MGLSILDGQNCYKMTYSKNPLKKDKTKVLKSRGSLINADQQYCRFDLHLAIIGLESLFWSSFEWPLKTGLTVYLSYKIVLLRKQ